MSRAERGESHVKAISERKSEIRQVISRIRESIMGRRRSSNGNATAAARSCTSNM